MGTVTAVLCAAFDAGTDEAIYVMRADVCAAAGPLDPLTAPPIR